MLLQKLSGLFHIGQLPATLRAQLEKEAAIIYLVEGIRETAIFRDFRAPGVCCIYRCMNFSGYFVMTEKRMVAKAKLFHQVEINAEYAGTFFRGIHFQAAPRFLSLIFDASMQSSTMSGQVEIRLHLPDIGEAVRLLQKFGANVKVEKNKNVNEQVHVTS